MAAAMQRKEEMPGKEIDEDGGGDHPPQVAVKPDKKIIRKVSINRDEKILRKVAMRNRNLYRPTEDTLEAAMEDGVSRLTMTSTEEIVLEYSRGSETKVGESTASDDPVDMASKVDFVPMICRTCGRLKCPIKDLVPQTKASVDRSPHADGDGPATPAICPICMQAANRRGRNMARLRSEDDMMRRRNEDTFVRVINLPEITCKRDLYNLVRPFGVVDHVDDPQLDENTVSCSKFGIVKFVQKQDAEVAVGWLNGYLYGSRTLRAEFITPKEKEVSVPSPFCAVCMQAVDASVRVKNLPKDTCEHDLYNLFCPFGIVNKLFLTFENTETGTGLGRKFGVVEFLQRDNAERAIGLLDGYAYGKLNLQVNWATLADLVFAATKK